MVEHNAQARFVEWIRKKAKTDDRFDFAYTIKDTTQGVSDIHIPYPVKRFHGLYIMFKVGKKKPDPEQKRFLIAMRDRGYCAMCINSFQDGVNLTTTYFEGDVR